MFFFLFNKSNFICFRYTSPLPINVSLDTPDTELSLGRREGVAIGRVRGLMKYL